MRHGVSIPCFGTGLDAALVADWAVAAESAGWDGFFLWDHLFAFAPARGTGAPYDLAVPGGTEGDDPDRVERYARHGDAGATWWVEAVHPWRYGWVEDRPWPLAPMRERIEAGP